MSTDVHLNARSAEMLTRAQILTTSAHHYSTVAPTVASVVPMVVVPEMRGERAYDIFSLLLKNRVVFLGTAVDDQLANLVIAQLLYLAQDDPEKEIQLYVNSPGGVVDAG